MFHPALNDETRLVAKLLMTQARIAVCDCGCPCNCLEIGDFGLDVDSCEVTVKGKVYTVHAAIGPHPKLAIPPDKEEWTCKICFRTDGECTC